MFFDPFSPPPQPSNEHEARIVGVIFVVMWGLGLILLYWQGSRTMKNIRSEKSAAVKGTAKPESMNE